MNYLLHLLICVIVTIETRRDFTLLFTFLLRFCVSCIYIAVAPLVDLVKLCSLKALVYWSIIFQQLILLLILCSAFYCT